MFSQIVNFLQSPLFCVSKRCFRYVTLAFPFAFFVYHHLADSHVLGVFLNLRSSLCQLVLKFCWTSFLLKIMEIFLPGSCLKAARFTDLPLGVGGGRFLGNMRQANFIRNASFLFFNDHLPPNPFLISLDLKCKEQT